MLAAVVIIFAVGLLMRAWIFQQVMKLGERALLHIPMVKVVYKALKDLFAMFSGDEQSNMLQVVCVEIPGTQMKLLALHPAAISDLAQGVANAGDVAVYLPMSYQIGGYTVVVPRSQVTPVDMAREQAMHFMHSELQPGKQPIMPADPVGAESEPSNTWQCL